MGLLLFATCPEPCRESMVEAGAPSRAQNLFSIVGRSGKWTDCWVPKRCKWCLRPLEGEVLVADTLYRSLGLTHPQHNLAETSV